MSKTLQQFDDSLDETTGVTPKAKTPEEMMVDPLSLLDEPTQTESEQQKKLDSTWDVTEGAGPHDASINDNDSKNGPAR